MVLSSSSATPPAFAAEEGGEDWPLLRVLETALLVSTQALTVAELCQLFAEPPSAADIRSGLLALQQDWQHRGLALTETAEGWRFATRLGFQPYLARMQAEKPPRYSRAALETLAIIAYKGPVTRGEIEQIRGVAVSSALIKTLEDRGWIAVVGHRESPGRPGLYATTATFLADLGLRQAADLPPLPSLGTLPSG